MRAGDKVNKNENQFNDEANVTVIRGGNLIMDFISDTDDNQWIAADCREWETFFRCTARSSNFFHKFTFNQLFASQIFHLECKHRFFPGFSHISSNEAQNVYFSSAFLLCNCNRTSGECKLHVRHKVNLTNVVEALVDCKFYSSFP